MRAETIDARCAGLSFCKKLNLSCSHHTYKTKIATRVSMRGGRSSQPPSLPPPATMQRQPSFRAPPTQPSHFAQVVREAQLKIPHALTKTPQNQARVSQYGSTAHTATQEHIVSNSIVQNPDQRNQPATQVGRTKAQRKSCCSCLSSTSKRQTPQHSITEQTVIPVTYTQIPPETKNTIPPPDPAAVPIASSDLNQTTTTATIGGTNGSPTISITVHQHNYPHTSTPG